MTKAEERALESYPVRMTTYLAGLNPYDLNAEDRLVYIAGYLQAEKDNTLTWEDMKLMQEIQLNVCARKVRGEKMTEEEQFSEVLKLFLEQKGDKV